MAVGSRSAHALMIGVSSVAMMSNLMLSAQAQSAMTLDAITVVATKTEENVTESLSAVSAIRQEQINQIMPRRTSDIFFGVPGVSFQERGDDPATAINIRGLQDFGRVAVLIDGARQNFQKSGHNANGAFYLEPELLSGVDIVRGPVANIYGSGAIGGVASFQTKDVNDILKPGERFGFAAHGMGGTNLGQGMGVGSFFAAARVAPNADIFAGTTYRSQDNYQTGTGDGATGLTPPDRTVPNTNSRTETGIAKFTVRPADGHEIKFTGLTYESNYVTGQPPSSTYRTEAKNHIVTTRYRYARPDDRLFDFDGNVYWTETRQDQVKITGATSSSTGRVGDPRYFLIDTVGTDLHNTSRIDTGPVRHAFTYGVDAFRDRVNAYDPGGVNDGFTPSGARTVSGGFLQWKANYSTWFEYIGAGRYDRYELEGATASSSGTRLSPKSTLGITPLKGFTVYGTYAEGYRAPALTETIATGFHPSFFGGPTPAFEFLPNPNLRPEVGKNKEVGINLKYDNVFAAGDKFRGKANVFRNDVDDYIEAVQFNRIGMVPGYQYRNIANARLEGFEFEASYDAGWWFAGLAGHSIVGKNVSNGGYLATVPADMIATTLGVRMLDRKLSAAVRWQAVDGKDGVPSGFTARPGYDLVNLYLGYDPRPDMSFGASIENALNRYYVRYLDGQPSPGITYKASLRIRFSDAYL